MGDAVIVCFNGTGKHSRSPKETNVMRLQSFLQQGVKVDELSGVGAEAPICSHLPKPAPLEIYFSQMTGWGLDHIVLEAYVHLTGRSDAEIKKIFIFGYSRGAYAARTLAALLNKFGVPDPGNHEQCVHFYKSFKRHEDHPARRSSREAEVKFLGLWDTVESTPFARSRPDVNCTTSSTTVRHALACHERRFHFKPKLFKNLEPDQEVERWFPGAHSDVGGRWREGQPEKEPTLSYITLHWMMDECAKTQADTNIIKSRPHEAPEIVNHYDAPIHDVLARFTWWWLPEVLCLHFGRCRTQGKTHCSVVRRMTQEKCESLCRCMRSKAQSPDEVPNSRLDAESTVVKVV